MKTPKHKGFCAHCGKPFVGTIRKVYCCNQCSCAAAQKRRQPPFVAENRNCEHCGAEFTTQSTHPNQIYCTKKCRTTANNNREREKLGYKKALIPHIPLEHCPFATGLIRDVHIFGPSNYHPGEAYGGVM